MLKKLLICGSVMSLASAQKSELFLTQKIFTTHAPTPIGPYSQAILIPLGSHSKQLIISGQIPWDMHRKHIITEIKAATTQVMLYLEAILQQAGMTFDHVVSTTIYLLDMNDFAAVNEIYSSFFKDCELLPARATVAVAGLPRGARVEIAMTAVHHTSG